MAFDAEEVRALFEEITEQENVWDVSLIQKVRTESPMAEESPKAIVAEKNE